MEKIINFDANVQQVQFDDYNESEYAMARVGYLSTRPNSHGLEISEKVLKTNADTVLGKWMVAKMNIFGTDAESHGPDEHIVGFFPKDQDIEFVEDDEGYLRAYATAIISKVYAKDYCKMFEDINNRSVSIEMTMDTENGNDMNDKVLSFNIVGVTTLGLSVRPSCPESDVTFVRFSQEEADAYFSKMNEHNLTPLKKFAKERISDMADEKFVSHPISTSKEDIYEGEWDGQKAKQDLVKEKNFKSLAPKVCMKLEEGWEDREVTKLGYPVMMLYDGKWVYSRQGLTSALGYAKKENETSVVNKIEKIYKNLGLDSDRKEEAKMSEINDTVMTDPAEMAEKSEEVEEEMAEKEQCEDCPESTEMAEGKAVEDNEEDSTEVKAGMSAEEADAEMARLKDEIESRDNIIMEKDKVIKDYETELCDLRAFKQACMEAERATKVDSIMAEVAKFMDKTQVDECRSEGLKCEFAEVDAWANKVKASVFDKVAKQPEKAEFTRMSAPIEVKNTGSVWDRL